MNMDLLERVQRKIHKDDQVNGAPLLRRLVLERVWVFHSEEKLQRDLEAPSGT